VNGILAIDTASPSGIALAFRPGPEVEPATIFVPGPQHHSQALIPAIDRLLGGHRDVLAAIGVVTGPGSYAGLRVGIATAESLALGLELPVYGVGAFAAIAQAARGLPSFLAIHPAGRGDVACQRFADGAPAGEPFVTARAALPTDLRFAGETAGTEGGIEVSPEDRAAAVVSIVSARMAAGERPRGIQAFYLTEPNITRPARTPLVAGANNGEPSNG
jgi:tRNA threonylcarbamoyl adenosine modification protein YeaZ